MVIIPVLNKQSNHRKTRKNRNRSTSVAVFCGATGNRTRDTRIFSPLLYQLSYGTLFSFGIAKVVIFFLPPNFSCNFVENREYGEFSGWQISVKDYICMMMFNFSRYSYTFSHDHETIY